MKPFVFFVALLVMLPSAVSAHVHVRDLSPKKGAVVTASPAMVRITFSEGVEPIFSAVAVTDNSGTVVSGKTRFLKDNTVMEADLPKNLAPGKYAVKWKCVSMDGHRQAGSYSITIR